MSLAHIEQTPHALASWRNNSIIRGGDEGVPVGAIARMLKHPSGEVRAVLRNAIARGQLLTMPRDEWPPGSERNMRMPDCVHVDGTSAEFSSKLMKHFKLTSTEAALFSMLVRRPETTKASLHLAVQKPDKDETEEKIVDVLVCKIRTKFRKRGPVELVDQIETIWGVGYYLTPVGRKFVMKTLGLPYDPGSYRTETAAFDGDQDEGAAQRTANAA